MATASVTNNFVNGNVADADAVDQNFTDLVDFLNDEVVHSDGANGPQYLQVRKTGSTAITTSTPTLVTWQAEDVDDWSGWTSGTNVTIATAGLYRVEASARWAASTTNAKVMDILVNSVVICGDLFTNTTIGKEPTNHAGRLITLAASDVVTVQVEQTTGANLSLLTSTFLSLTLLRAS